MAATSAAGNQSNVSRGISSTGNKLHAEPTHHRPLRISRRNSKNAHRLIVPTQNLSVRPHILIPNDPQARRLRNLILRQIAPTCCITSMTTVVQLNHIQHMPIGSTHHEIENLTVKPVARRTIPAHHINQCRHRNLGMNHRIRQRITQRTKKLKLARRHQVSSNILHRPRSRTPTTAPSSSGNRHHRDYNARQHNERDSVHQYPQQKARIFTYSSTSELQTVAICYVACKIPTVLRDISRRHSERRLSHRHSSSARAALAQL